MDRIYHRYEVWECHKAGFFNNISGLNKETHIQKVVELFSSKEKTFEFMKRVVNEWLYSTEHNLTNISMNRIAWLGQAACCIYAGTPCSITMEAWHKVDKEYRDRADEIADQIIKEWEQKQINNRQYA